MTEDGGRRRSRPCEHLFTALSAIRDAAAAGAPMTAELSAQQSGDLWMYVVRLQDAVESADENWNDHDHGPGDYGSPERLVCDAAAESRGLDHEWREGR